MFSSCAFCSGPFAGDGGTSGLGVGRRFAFDAWKARAWVVCLKCRRWNLTPLEGRLETIASLEHLAAGGRVAAASDRVALLRAGSYEVVRVGKPPRVEMATWRYGERLKARERERLKVLLPVALLGVGAAIAVGVATGGSGLEMLAYSDLSAVGDAIYGGVVGSRRITGIEPQVCAHCGRAMVLRTRHLARARLSRTLHADLALLLVCPRCREVGALLQGREAELALRHGLVYVNLKKGKKVQKKAVEAAAYLERHGGPETVLAARAKFELVLSGLEPEESLALEMAVDEQAEVRELERDWREAEEVAEIADNLLVDPSVEERLRQLRAERGKPPAGP